MAHKKGVGRKLIEKIEKTAKKRKIKKLIVHSTPYAEEFYKRCGYKRIKKIKAFVKEDKSIRWTVFYRRTNMEFYNCSKQCT